MIYIVNAENRGLFDAELSAMHRARKHIFVDTLGWQLPIHNGEEIDQYDTDDTTYLLAHSPQVTPIASARLLPTTVPHLMCDLFAHTCEGGAPHGDHIWEASRFCPSPALSRRERIAALWPIFCGILETALLFDIAQIIFTANAALLPLALKCGWHARVLGPTFADGADTVTAVRVDVDRAGLRLLRRRFLVPSPITRFVSPVRRAA